MDKFGRSTLAIGLVVLLASMALNAATEQTSKRLKTRNVVLIVLDGVRWQEVFTGADPVLLNSEHGGVSVDLNTFRKEFWRDDVTQRRQVLFPMSSNQKKFDVPTSRPRPTLVKFSQPIRSVQKKDLHKYRRRRAPLSIGGP